MESIGLLGTTWHKQRERLLMEEARVERFLQEKRQRDELAWMQRHSQRNRKRD